MRKALTFILPVAMVAFLAMPLIAQSRVVGGSLAGRSVDVAGRGVAGERVELLSDTTVVSTVETNGLGEWSFKSVQPGVYVVRMNVRGRVAGVRVTVAAGQVIAGTMIVIPAATVSSQLGVLANLLTLVPTGIATTASITAQTVQVTDTTELSPALLVQVLSAMSSTERQAFSAAVYQAIKDIPVGEATFAQYKEQFQQMAASPTAAIPTFQPPLPVS
jgi:hypothetical protein